MNGLVQITESAREQVACIQGGFQWERLQASCLSARPQLLAPLGPQCLCVRVNPEERGGKPHRGPSQHTLRMAQTVVLSSRHLVSVRYESGPELAARGER